MAHSDALPTGAIESVEEQIGRLLPSLLGAQAPMNIRVQIGESFTLWMLGLDAINRQEPIHNAASPLQRWHHQISYDGEPRAFARSLQLDPAGSDLRVDEIAESAIAAAIDGVIDWIDKEIAGDPLVRLLVVPAHYLHAFWLREADSDQIVVIDRPSGLDVLPYNTALDPLEFMTILSRQPKKNGLQPPTA